MDLSFVSLYLNYKGNRFFFASMKFHHMVIYELHRHMLWDDELRKCLGDDVIAQTSFNTAKDEAVYLARIIQFSISRPFIKRNKETGELILANWYKPKTRNSFRRVSIAKCSDYFRGREIEIKRLYEKLGAKDKVLLRGIPGIGKSELAYAYAEKYGEE